MVVKWSVTIPALTGEEPRNAYAYVPDGAEREPERRYPVLYMFDGHNVFYDEDATYGKSWGMEEYLVRTGTELIVAAVECDHSPDNGRLSEYSPYSFQAPGLGRVTGRGRETMEWLVHSFKPMIDREFPTLRGRKNTFLAGSSMGGLMSLYGVLEYNRVFSRGAALSPSLWFARAKLDALIQRAQVRPGTVLYMDYGSRELDAHPNMARQLSRVAGKLLDKGVLLDCRVVPGGEHCEASWERQIPFFMNTLLYGR